MFELQGIQAEGADQDWSFHITGERTGGKRVHGPCPKVTKKTAFGTRPRTGELICTPRTGDREGWMPHPWRFHGWAAMAMGSGDFADVELCFLGLIDQNRAAFAIGVMSEAAPQPLLGLQN